VLKFSKKADYALMALQHIAAVQFGDVTKARIVNTKEIAEEHYIPVELLAKVLQTLAKHGIVESQNGPKGGYYWLDTHAPSQLHRFSKPSKAR
jgi:Rrf2 family cysteine metabolism transcriptional repressor